MRDTNLIGALPSARAASLRPQPATPFSQSGIANAGARTGFTVIVNHEHIARVLRIRRQLCIGESVG